MTKKIVALAGDGIGPEILEAGLEVLEALAEKQVLTMRLTDDLLEGQVLMLQDIPCLMKPSRLLEKRMLFCSLQSVVLSMMMLQFDLNKGFWPFERN